MLSRSSAVPVAPQASTDSTTSLASGPIVGRLRALADRPVLVVGAIVLVAATVAGAFSLQVVRYEPDEVGYTHLAIGIARSLSPITLRYDGGNRLNQLYPLLIAPIWGLFGNVTAFRIVHIWNVLLMASAAIPTYLLAREVVNPRWAAYLAAALVAVTPWITLSLAELTEVAAFPVCAWALLAMQRSLADPSPRRDLLALAAIVFATYGRLQLIMLAPILVVAMLFHELSYGLMAHNDSRTGLRKAFVRMARRHAPLSAISVVGVIVGIPLLLSGRLASVFGFYGNTLSGVTLNGATLDLARSYVVFMALGLGALPAALALGFFGESLLAPVSRAAHAFSSLAIVTVLALTLQVAEVSERFNEGVLQERYLFYIVPLLAVGMCAGLLLTRHPLKMVLGGSIVLAVLTASTHYQSQRNAFWYQVSPAMTSFYDWVRPAFGAAGGPTADPGASRQVLAGVIIFALGLLAATIARRISPSRMLACVATLAIVFCGAETVQALWRVVNGNSSGIGFGHGSFHKVDWVDRNVPEGVPVAQVVSNVEGHALASSRGLWEDSEFWNRSIVSAYTFGGIGDSYLSTTTLSMNRQSGAVMLGPSASASAGVPTQRYIVTAARGFPVDFAGSVLAYSPTGTLELVRLAVPPRAAWAVLGVSSDGWLALDRPATLRLYALQGTPNRCAKVGVTLSLSSLSSSARELRLSGSSERSVRFTPGETNTVYVRVCRQAGTVPQLRLLNSQSPAATDPQLTLQLQRVTVTPA